MDFIKMSVNHPLKIELIDKTYEWEPESVTIIVKPAHHRHPGFTVYFGDITENVICLPESPERMKQLEVELGG
jgi:hypothetical protein